MSTTPAMQAYLCIWACDCGDCDATREAIVYAESEAAAAGTIDTLNEISADHVAVHSAKILRDLATMLDNATAHPERRCPHCSLLHDPCTRCGKPTECDPQELGEQWDLCEACNADDVLKEGGAE